MQLATFPRSCSPLSESEQQSALTALLDTACTSPSAQASFPQSSDLVKPPHPQQPAVSSSNDQEAVSNLVSSAWESMASSGYEDSLSSVALPRLFAAAHLPAPNLALSTEAQNSEHPGAPNAAPTEATITEEVNPSAAPAAEKITTGLGRHGGRGANGEAVSEPESSGRSGAVVHTALRALASIAKASEQLRAPILAACMAGIPAALLAAAGNGKDSLASFHLTCLHVWEVALLLHLTGPPAADWPLSALIPYSSLSVHIKT